MIGELEHKEVELKSSLPTRIAEVLKAKRLVLFKTLLEEANHPDDLVTDLCKGFDLTGRLPESGVFKQKFRPASISKSSLREFAKVARSSFLISCKSSGDDEMDKALYDATIKEVRKGFITKRFPVRQKNKIRPSMTIEPRW